MYSEVLIAGDLSKEDIIQTGTQGILSTTDLDTAEFIYGKGAANTVYLAQPSLSQFVPGGSGAGAFHEPMPLGVKDRVWSSSSLSLMNRHTLKNDTGAVLRYAPSGAC